MDEGNIQESVKAITSLWRETGKNVGAEETRKWIQPHVNAITKIMGNKDAVEMLKKITAEAFPDGEWQAAVALNQIVFLGKIDKNPDKTAEILKKFYDVWNRQPLNLSPLLVEWRKQSIGSNLGPEIILETLNYDPSKQSYFDPQISGSGVDFFMNMYKDEMGVDVDALSEAVSKIIGDDLVGEFFRLVDIDAPLPPEEFVKRVEKGVDVLATAKEQGLDVRRIFRKWDELANAGGERMKFLAAAVKAVAEEAVRERFWEGFMERAKKLKVPVIDDEPDVTELISVLHSMGLVTIRGGEIEFGKEFDTLMENTLEILMKLSPSAIYTSTDLAEAMLKILRAGGSKESVVKASSMLATLDVDTLRRAMSEDMLSAVISAVDEIVAGGGVKDDEIVTALRAVLPDANPENIKQLLINKIHEIKER